MPFRRRLVPATEPEAEPACRLTPEEGRARQPNTDYVFGHVVASRDEGPARVLELADGDRERLWRHVNQFVDGESRCCPFFGFAVEETAAGLTLTITLPPALGVAS